MKRIAFQEPDVIEASDLGWRPGQVAPRLQHDGETYLLVGEAKFNDEVIGWNYQSADSDKTLVVVND